MKITTIIACCLFLALNSKAQSTNPNYDSTLAKTLGADEFGMKMYTMVILKTGTNTTESKESKDTLFAGHLANIKRLADLNKLVIAGPFGKNDKNFRGIFILNVANEAEAMALLETDPAIKAKLLQPELYPWYGSAAISEYLKSHDKIWKAKP